MTRFFSLARSVSLFIPLLLLHALAIYTLQHIYINTRMCIVYINTHVQYTYVYLYLYIYPPFPPPPHTHMHIYTYTYMYICTYIPSGDSRGVGAGSRRHGQ